MIELILKISILAWPFGQFLRTSFEGMPIYLLDAIALILSISLIISKTSRHQIFSNKISKYLFLFLLASTVSLIVNIPYLSFPQLIRAIFYLTRLVIYPSFFYAVFACNLNRIRSTIKASIIIFLILSIIQYLLFPDATSLKYLGFDDHYYRLISTFFDPNYTGLALLIIFVYLLATNKYFFSISVIPLIALTFSRATYITFILSSLIIALSKKSRYLLLTLGVLLISIVLIPKPFGEGVNLLRTFSIYSRMDSWMTGLNLFLQKPVFGWGYNTLSDINNQRIGVDNSFIYIMATTGAVGLLTFLVLLYKMLTKIVKTEYFVCLLAILFHSLFNNSLFFIWIFSAFWFIYGLSQKS